MFEWVRNGKKSSRVYLTQTKIERHLKKNSDQLRKSSKSEYVNMSTFTGSAPLRLVDLDLLEQLWLCV